MRSALPETYSWANTRRVQTDTGPRRQPADLANPYCRVVEPFLTSFRGLATYLVPKIDLQVSGTWRSDPGHELAANYVVTNAIALPSLGRNLSSGNVTVNLVEPGTLYGDRHQQHRPADREDPAVRTDAHAVRCRPLQPAEQRRRDGYNNGYSPTGAWLTPTAILPARYVRLNLQFDF